MAPATVDLARIAALDRRLLQAVRGIHILQTLSWPASLEDRLIAEYARGHCVLPEIEPVRPDLAAARVELEAIERAAGRFAPDPLADYLACTAASWRIAAEMLEAAGTPGVGAASALLYGRPGDAIPGSTRTHLDAARYFVDLADELGAELPEDELREDAGAEVLRAELDQVLAATFGAGAVRVEIDPELTAKAAAGASRIRLRGGARFSGYDHHQLIAHEALVHTLTARNGREQPVLASLARTAPRATATQEGLAVFAELMSGAIDIQRLKRIGLRILAIDMAFAGADFVEVHRFFHGHGQSVADSFHSAQRVFRGVPVTGGSAFAKDNVYLSGLITVHTFFRWALRERRLDTLRHLFAGKFALADVVALEGHFAAGTLIAPRWLPPWMHHVHGLAGRLAFSLFINRVRMGEVDAEALFGPA